MIIHSIFYSKTFFLHSSKTKTRPVRFCSNLTLIVLTLGVFHAATFQLKEVRAYARAVIESSRYNNSRDEENRNVLLASSQDIIPLQPSTVNTIFFLNAVHHFY